MSGTVIAIMAVCLLLAILNAAQGAWDVAAGNIVGLVAALFIMALFRRRRD